MSLPELNEGKIVSDAWDYTGKPAERLKTGGWSAAAMILGGIIIKEHWTHKHTFVFFLLCLLFRIKH